MRRIALALALACALAGCGVRADLEAAFGHELRDVRVLKVRGYAETFVVGRIRDEVPFGFARSLPWEGRCVPFAAQLHGEHVDWIRELPELREPPAMALAGGRLLLATRADVEAFVRPDCGD